MFFKIFSSFEIKVKSSLLKEEPFEELKDDIFQGWN
jgi:hypothetical protein